MVKRRRERKTRSESKTLRRELGELAEAFGDKSPEERRELEALRREIEDLEREETAFDSPAERRKRGAWLRHWLGQAVAAGPVAAALLDEAKETARRAGFEELYIFDWCTLQADGAARARKGAPVTLPPPPPAESR